MPCSCLVFFMLWQGNPKFLLHSGSCRKKVCLSQPVRIPTYDRGQLISHSVGSSSYRPLLWLTHTWIEPVHSDLFTFRKQKKEEEKKWAIIKRSAAPYAPRSWNELSNIRTNQKEVFEYEYSNTSILSSLLDLLIIVISSNGLLIFWYLLMASYNQPMMAMPGAEQDS